MNREERHARHHEQIEERVAAYRAAPRRSGLDKVRRREQFKSAYWTITGHLRGEHIGHGRIPFGSTLEGLLEWHDKLHEESRKES